MTKIIIRCGLIVGFWLAYVRVCVSLNATHINFDVTHYSPDKKAAAATTATAEEEDMLLI